MLVAVNDIAGKRTPRLHGCRRSVFVCFYFVGLLGPCLKLNLKKIKAGTFGLTKCLSECDVILKGLGGFYKWMDVTAVF